MHSRIGAWLRHARATWFPKRELYIRCNGVVRYWVIGRRLQWIAASTAAAAGLWLLTSTTLLLVDWLVFDEPGRIAAAVDAVRDDMAAQTDRLRGAVAELDARRLENLDKLTAAQQTVASLRADNEILRHAHARLNRQRQDAVGEAETLLRRLRQTAAELAATRRQAETALAEAQARAATDLARQRGDADARLADLRRRLAAATSAQAETAKALQRSRAALAASEAGQDKAEAQLAAMQRQHRQTLAQLRSAAAAARSQAMLAMDAYAGSASELRRTRAIASAAQSQAQTALADAEAARRRASAAAARQASAETLTARLSDALTTLNRRLHKVLDEADPSSAAEIVAALDVDLAATVARRRPLADPVALAAKVVPAVDAIQAQRLLAASLVAQDQAKRDGAAAMRALSEIKLARRDDLAPEVVAGEADGLIERLARTRRDADRRAGYYVNRIARLQSRLGELQERQAVLVGQLEDQTVAAIDVLEGTVHATGLDLVELLRRMDHEVGIGGPYIGLPSVGRAGSELAWVGTPAPETEPALGDPLERLYGRLARWKALNMALKRVPLTPPVDNFYISSNFGKRRDPYTKRWAMHSGIDMAGPRNAPIFATAPGTVTKAGWLGQYGAMVEIDHGFGLTTRYGHMRKVLVKRGQTVAFRERIGIMGSTGRSTDRHVHYEVRFDDEPVDPAKFIEAGRNVFKN